MEYMMKTLTLNKFDCDYLEVANESHQIIDTDGVYDEDIDSE